MAVGSSLPNLIAPKDAGVGSSAAFEPNHMAVGDSQPSVRVWTGCGWCVNGVGGEAVPSQPPFTHPHPFHTQLFPMDAAVGSSLPGGGVDRSIGMGNDTLRGMGAFGGERRCTSYMPACILSLQYQG
jgi:hypothetical protein